MNPPSGPTTRRIFLGIPVPPALVSEISAVQAADKSSTNLKWIPLANLHVTVLFIGAIPVDMTDNLISLIRLHLRGTQSFALQDPRWTFAPAGKPPRMIWIRYGKETAFSILVSKMRTAIGSVLKLPQQYPDPIPHVTIARFAPTQKPPPFSLPLQVQSQILPVQKLILWESILSDQGATYLPLAEFDLKA